MADPQRESERKGVASFKADAEAVGAAEEEHLMLTISTPVGRIVRVEKVDKGGKSRELAEEEWAKLVGKDKVDDIEIALEEAFEAGVAVVFGEEYENGEDYEDKEERALRRLLIGRLFRRSIRRRILQRLLVSRLLRSDSSEAGVSKKPKSVSPQKGA